MKNNLTILLFVLCAYFVQGQSIELNKSEAKEEYCMILATQKFLSTKVKISIDFGQEVSFWKNTVRAQTLKDEKGKAISFNSVIDALNYMSSKGWEFVNAYAITVDNENVLHYVMKRQLTEADKKEN